MKNEVNLSSYQVIREPRSGVGPAILFNALHQEWIIIGLILM